MQDLATNIRIFKALSDENRVKLLHYIQKANPSQQCAEGECGPKDVCVTNLAETFGLTPATVSHHIKELVNAGLITTRKEGRWVYCQVNQAALSQISTFVDQLGKE